MNSFAEETNLTDHSVFYDFSVIVLTRNRLVDLEKTLRSLAFLCRPSWELVLVDNGSSEETKKGMNDLLNELKFEHIKFITLERNLGVAGGRNAGIENSSGKYLFFLDDDAVIVDKEFLKKSQEYFENNPSVAILACNIVNTRTARLQIGRRFLQEDIECVLTFRGGGCLIRNELFKSGKLPLFPSTLFYGAEEDFLSYIVYDLGFSIRLCFDLVVLHSPGTSSRLPKYSAICNRIVNKAVVNTLLFPEKYRRKILMTMRLRLLRHLWKSPKNIFRSTKLYEDRLVGSQKVRSLSESTIAFLIKVNPHIM